LCKACYGENVSGEWLRLCVADHCSCCSCPDVLWRLLVVLGNMIGQIRQFLSCTWARALSSDRAGFRREMDRHHLLWYTFGQDRMAPHTMNRTSIPIDLVAPCGMNCRLCRAHLREKKACPGCRGNATFKSNSCRVCPIKSCERLTGPNSTYCFSCTDFPCTRLSHLDKRYRTKYGMSMVDNLREIRDLGVRRFIKNQRGAWTCPECGRLMSVHKPLCLFCGHRWQQSEPDGTGRTPGRS
jgi:hypothetical protein